MGREVSYEDFELVNAEDAQQPEIQVSEQEDGFMVVEQENKKQEAVVESERKQAAKQTKPPRPARIEPEPLRREPEGYAASLESSRASGFQKIKPFEMEQFLKGATVEMGLNGRELLSNSNDIDPEKFSYKNIINKVIEKSNNDKNWIEDTQASRGGDRGLR